MWPIILIGAALVYSYARGADQITKQIQYAFKGVTLIKSESSLMGLAFKINLELINPSNGSVKINSVAGTITSNGTEVANYNYLKPFEITPQGRTTIAIIANVDITSAAKLLFGAITKGEITAFRISGFINTPGLAVPTLYETKSLSIKKKTA